VILSPSASALAVGGGLWSRSDQLNNAQREANARNGVLSTAINGLNQDYNKVAEDRSGARPLGVLQARSSRNAANCPAKRGGVERRSPATRRQRSPRAAHHR
jgi:hypothetical protein